LGRFHGEAPVAACPFDFRLDAAVAQAHRKVREGRIEVARDFHEEHLHLEVADALVELDRLRPGGEDVVVCHGDSCPPNVLIARGRAVGFVDLGGLGVADRWWDLAVATWAVSWNFGPGLEGLLLDVYGEPPDPARQAFYRLLFDLAS
jgi:kanamycin kinase